MDFIRSFVVEMLLLKAHELGKDIRVIVVDSRPLMEGRHLLRTLAANGVTCTYVLINSLSYIMQVSFHTLLQTGTVL